MPGLAPSEIFLFEDFRLDRRGALSRRDDIGAFVPVAIGSRALDILGVLVERAGEVVSKEEIITAVWPETVVEDSNLTVQISALRRILDDARLEGSCIQTVPGRGYRFATVVTRPTGETPPPLPDKPSIAVLPFANMSGDPEQEYFADGMVEEIITALSRIRWLFVIARNSSFTYKGQAIDVTQVGRELGVRDVLEGSVRKAGSRMRIAAQLIEAHSGRHIWADRFDGSLEDVFDLQDKVASSVAGVIQPALQAAETARSARRPTSDLTAYDLFLRASAMFRSSARQIPESLRLLERAIARDPWYAPALTGAGLCCFRLHLDGRSEDPATHARKGADYAHRALEVAGDNPAILAQVAPVLSYFGEDIGAMLALVDRALALDPNSAGSWHISGLLRNWAGEPDIAIDHIKTAVRLSPRIRVGGSMIQLGLAHFLARRFDAALPLLALAIQEDPSHPMPQRVLAACYARMGRLDEAQEAIARLREITPVIIPDASFLRNPEHRELFLSGLRLAAGAEPIT